MKYKVTNTGKGYVILNDSKRTGLAPGETKTIEEECDFGSMAVEVIDKKKKEVTE